MPRRFCQVDVFGAAPGRGNPVAVVLDAEGLSTAQMQAFARWTDLSETTFVLPPTAPGADYQVRIFTPTGELPFAGHPTLGTCHAWLTSGGQDEIDPGRDVVQQCAAGPVRVRRDLLAEGGHLAFAAPPLVRSGPVDGDLLAQVLAVLQMPEGALVDAAWVDNGPGWVAVQVRDVDTLLALRPGPVGDLMIGAVALYPPGSAAQVEVRAFFGVDGATREDPVTGSLNASLAPWLVGAGRVGPRYVARQGSVVGADGEVQVVTEDDEDHPGHPVTWIAGATTTLVTGTVTVP